MWKDIEDNKKCLEMWEREAECRDRNQTFKLMSKVDKKVTEKVQRNHMYLCILYWQGVVVLSPTPASLLLNNRILLNMMQWLDQTQPISDKVRLGLYPLLGHGFCETTVRAYMGSEKPVQCGVLPE